MHCSVGHSDLHCTVWPDSPACQLPGFRLQSIVATNPVLTISPHYHRNHYNNTILTIVIIAIIIIAIIIIAIIIITSFKSSSPSCRLSSSYHWLHIINSSCDLFAHFSSLSSPVLRQKKKNQIVTIFSFSPRPNLQLFLLVYICSLFSLSNICNFDDIITSRTVMVISWCVLGRRWGLQRGWQGNSDSCFFNSAVQPTIPLCTVDVASSKYSIQSTATVDYSMGSATA